eukprot:Blabericola_migrator_1__13038@NODE_876_length_6200_cov_16_387575_g620_i0_p1_GENE_NODE_876_length_6200_cov_16_387575_g620_i0NODE_876_length_6200_cov_16_387575_g620_i0_p1_ORF_typecomplete_len1293_score236_90_NODE_876_length_6200_cov_16_387575_g620_i022906168
MPATGRCIIRSHNKYQSRNDDTSAVRTLGLGLCCVLSVHGVTNVANNEAHIASTNNPRLHSKGQTLRENEVISTFCDTYFKLIPHRGQADWMLKVQASFNSLDFATSAALEHVDKLCACIRQVEIALLEADLDKKLALSDAEVIAIHTFRDILSQLDNAITQYCPDGPLGSLRKDVANVQYYCQLLSQAPTKGIDEAWHKRARLLLAKVPLTRHQKPAQSELWDQMAEVLNDAEGILQSRRFSDDELDTINQISMVAVQSAPVWPCVAQCAKLWFEMEVVATDSQRPHKKGTIFCGPEVQAPSEKGRVEASLRPDLEKPHDYSQGNNPFGDFVPRAPQQVPWSELSRQPSCQQSIVSNSEKHQVQSQVKQHRLGSPNLNERVLLSVEPEVQPRGRPPQKSASQPLSDEALNKSVDERSEDGHGHLCEKLPSVLKELEQQASALRVHNFTNLSVQASIQATRQLLKLNRILSQLDEKPLDTQLLTSLGRIRSSLFNTRQKILDLNGRSSLSHMTGLNEAIEKVSRLWHLTRLAKMKILDPLQPENFESVARLEGSQTQYSIPSFVASETYTALLRYGSEEALNNLLVFLNSTSNPIDLSTAKLCLLNLLFLRYEKVELLIPKARYALSKLISKLRHEIFEAKKTEVLISNLPEFNNFCLAYFGKRPVSTLLKLYSDYFSRSLSQDLNLTKVAEAHQVDSLKAFQSHLLSINIHERMASDEETLAYFEQFATFAKGCLDECQIHGQQTLDEELVVLKVTMDGLMWCRLLFSNAGVTPPTALRETYDAIAKAWILKSLWLRGETTSLLTSERAFISKRILAVLESGKHDKLLACLKAFLDRSVPLIFVETVMDDLLWDRRTSEPKSSDDDKMVMLLASECRLHLLKADVAHQPTRMSQQLRTAAGHFFTTSFIQAQLVAKDCHSLPAPDVSPALHDKLHEYFLAPSAPQTTAEAARSLSPDFVLKEALKEIKSDGLTVSEVGYQVATYLLGISREKQHHNSLDQQWLDFLTCQLKGCTLDLEQCRDRRKLMTLVRSIDTFFGTFWQEHKRNPIKAETTPYFIRHFVNMTALKWLLDKKGRDLNWRPKDRHYLSKTVGLHFFAWMPRWLTLMNTRQVLFPPDVTVEADSLCENLCNDVSCHVDYVYRWARELNGPLKPAEMRVHLRDLMKGLGVGLVTKQSLEVLLERHTSPMISRWNRNLFLTFLLYVWHLRCLPVDMNVIKDCIKLTVDECLRYQQDDAGMSVRTMQECIRKVLIAWSGDVQSPEGANMIEDLIESEENDFTVTRQLAAPSEKE